MRKRTERSVGTEKIYRRPFAQACVKSGISELVSLPGNTAAICGTSNSGRYDDDDATMAMMMTGNRMNVVCAPKCQSRRMCRVIALALISACIGFNIADGVPAANAQPPGQQPSAAEEGKLLFAKCGACHALTPGRNGRGPTLYHLFGRQAGAVPGYDYSLAMKRAGIVWREDSLMQFILDPERIVPGTKMRFSLSENYQQTRALIDYLRAVTR